MKNDAIPANNTMESDLFKDVDCNVNTNEVIIPIPEYNYEFKITYDNEYRIKIPNYSLPTQMSFKKFFNITNSSRDQDLIRFLSLYGEIELDKAKKIIIQFNKLIGSDEYHKKLENLMITHDENEEDSESKSEPFEAPEIMQKAEEILKNGDPFNYMMDVYQTIHVGDRMVFTNIFLGVMNQSVINSKGLQISFNGGSSDGKSHAVKSTLKLIPSHQFIDASISSKALFYHPDLKPKTIIYSDDTTMLPELEGTLKRSMTNFQEETKHLTVDGDRKGAKLLTIPKCILYLFTSVEEHGGQELQNRKVQVTVEDSLSHKYGIVNNQKINVKRGYDPYLNIITEEMLICQAIFNKYHTIDFGVAIPYADRIEGYDLKNVRNNDKLFAMIMGFTLSKFMQREIDANGNLIATEEDFNNAAFTYNTLYKNITTNLTDNEIKMCKCINGYGRHGATSKELQTDLKISQSTVSKRISSIESKISNLIIDDGSESEGTYDGHGSTTSSNKKVKRYYLYNFDENNLNKSVYLVDEPIDFNCLIKQARHDEKKQEIEERIREADAKKQKELQSQPKKLSLLLEDHFEDSSD